MELTLPCCTLSVRSHWIFELLSQEFFCETVTDVTDLLDSRLSHLYDKMEDTFMRKLLRTVRDMTSVTIFYCDNKEENKEEKVLQ